MKQMSICLLALAVLLAGIPAGAAETVLPGTPAAMQASQTPAAAPDATVSANVLASLGMLYGTGNGYELQRDVTRAEAVALIARVTGEDRILDAEASPFSDVCGHWAQSLIDHFYQQGYVAGVTQTRFEPDRTVTGREFVRILLTVLGYDNVTIAQACDMGEAAGLLGNTYARSAVYSDQALSRSDAVRLCHSALSARTPDGQTLSQYLIDTTNYTADDFAGILLSADDEAAGDTGFAAALGSQMPKDQNYMLSPLSIKMALAMTANGTSGQAQEEICNALHISDLQSYNAYARDLIDKYASYHVINLSIANSLWLNTDQSDGIFFRDSYKDLIATWYNGESGTVTDADACDRVNSWVSEKTNGKIPSILSDSDFIGALINAIYFKAQWADPFDAGDTHEAAFTSRDGSVAQLDFMNQTRFYPYYEDDSYQLVRIPYSNIDYDDPADPYTHQNIRSLQISMDIILPREGATLDWQTALNPGELNDRRVRLSIPKFQTEFSCDLTEMLRALGIRSVFSPGTANLGEMFSPDEPNLCMQRTIHKTFISVDEQGTEAAAVTAMMAGTGMPSLDEPVSFTANHPFLYVIRDNLTGEILFMGEYAFAQ